MGLTLKTDDKGVKIFKNEKEWSGGKFYTYSMKIASKSQDGEWLNGYIDCAFKKGVEVNNKATIVIHNAFPTVTKSKDKYYVKWLITEFTVVDEGETDVPVNVDDFMNIPADIDEQIPFE